MSCSEVYPTLFISTIFCILAAQMCFPIPHFDARTDAARRVIRGICFREFSQLISSWSGEKGLTRATAINQSSSSGRGLGPLNLAMNLRATLTTANTQRAITTALSLGARSSDRSMPTGGGPRTSSTVRSFMPGLYGHFPFRGVRKIDFGSGQSIIYGPRPKDRASDTESLPQFLGPGTAEIIAILHRFNHKAILQPHFLQVIHGTGRNSYSRVAGGWGPGRKGYIFPFSLATSTARGP